jgi:hypothetical protein
VPSTRQGHRLGATSPGPDLARRFGRRRFRARTVGAAHHGFKRCDTPSVSNSGRVAASTPYTAASYRPRRQRYPPDDTVDASVDDRRASVASRRNAARRDAEVLRDRGAIRSTASSSRVPHDRCEWVAIFFVGRGFDDRYVSTAARGPRPRGAGVLVWQAHAPGQARRRVYVCHAW